MVRELSRHQLKTPPNGYEELRWDCEAGFQVLEDEGLVLQLLPLRHRERRRLPRHRRWRRNAHPFFFFGFLKFVCGGWGLCCYAEEEKEGEEEEGLSVEERGLHLEEKGEI